jgi:hypothetical protein
MTDRPTTPDPATQPTPGGKEDALIEEAEETATVDPADTPEGAAQLARHEHDDEPARKS